MSLSLLVGRPVRCCYGAAVLFIEPRSFLRLSRIQRSQTGCANRRNLGVNHGEVRDRFWGKLETRLAGVVAENRVHRSRQPLCRTMGRVASADRRGNGTSSGAFASAYLQRVQLKGQPRCLFFCAASSFLRRFSR